MKFVVSRKREKKVVYFFFTDFHFSAFQSAPCPSSSVTLCERSSSFHAHFLLLYLRSLRNIQNTSPRQPQRMMYICLALHSGQRRQFISVTLLSLLKIFLFFFFLVVVFRTSWGEAAVASQFCALYIWARRHIIALRGHVRAVTRRRSGEGCVVFSLHRQV